MTAIAPTFDLAAFRAFIDSLGLRYFRAEEFLALGSSNDPGGACAGLNHPPPPELWKNIARPARMIDAIRHRLAAPVILLSVFRSPAYNRCVGGKSASQHLRFNAIDFLCVRGTPDHWHAVARDVRAATPDFAGGIGRYPGFVHIDTRGAIANW